MKHYQPILFNGDYVTFNFHNKPMKVKLLDNTINYIESFQDFVMIDYKDGKYILQSVEYKEQIFEIGTDKLFNNFFTK